MQKLKNSEALPKLTGSYKNSVYFNYENVTGLRQHKNLTSWLVYVYETKLSTLIILFVFLS